MNESNSVLYVSICSAESSPGIYKKVTGFINGAKKNGFQSQAKIIEPNGIRGNIAFIRQILFAKEKNIIIRYIPKLGFIIFVLGICLKLKNQRFFIDVPTPMTNHLIEIFNGHNPRLQKIVNILFIVLMGSIPFLSCTKIIQYSNESSFFSFLCSKKILLIGNGIDCDSISPRLESPLWPAETLKLVAVGTVAFWHGWDKIIKVISQINKDETIPYNIHLSVIGDGPDLKILEKLVKNLGIQEFVYFPGFLSGSLLEEQYKKAHFGIGSLGWDRVNIKLASPIKTREYLASGLPVIYSTKDVDLAQNNELAIYVEAREDNKELKKILSSMDKRIIPHPLACYEFSTLNFDFSKKVLQILDY